ncbi:MAG: ABC transporter permease [Clostridiales bacterium]|nr:ABC transporter permease [Clostridiales bacterium]
MKKEKKGAGYWALYFALPLIILAIWQWADIAGWIKPYTMPSLSAIAEVTVEYLQNGKLLENMWVSFFRVIQGFLLALVCAFTIGMAAALFRKVEIATDLIIQILRPIPPIAWIPLAILWFGIGESSKIFIIFLGAFFPIFINIVDGVKSIDHKYYELAEVYEIPEIKMIGQIVIPGALPAIMTGVRVGLGNAWVCVVAAEMIGATKGVGYMLSNGRSLSRPDMVVLGMLIVGIVGKLMDDLLRFIRAKLITWI